MARHVMEEYRVKQVIRNGQMYRFSVMHEPAYSTYRAGEELVEYPARTEFHASAWTGYEWKTLHRFYVEG